MPAGLRLLSLGLLLLTSLSAAPAPWTQLKVGMSANEAVSLLGHPLFRSAGRGFETWTYDAGGEVVVYGLVVGWTLPASVANGARSEDVWSNQPGGDYFGTLRAAVGNAGPKAGRNPAGRAANRQNRLIVSRDGY